MVEGMFHAFIDDSGDSGLSLDKSGTSLHYTLAAVVVAEAALPRVRDEVEAVRQQHFQTGEMKSSGIGRGDGRRRRVLADLQRVDFGIVGFVVHKDRIARAQGLQYHDSFVKFLSRPIYRDLCSAYDELTLTADSHGDAAFMDSFRGYIATNAPQRTLFSSRPHLHFVDSRSEVLVQLADLVAGTLARCADSPTSPGSRTFSQILNTKAIRLSEWPGDYAPYVVELAERDGLQLEPRLAAYAVHEAEQFSEQHRGVAARELQVCFVDHLLSQLRFGSPLAYVTTPGVIHHIEQATGTRLRKDELRRDVVGPVRDAGVLVASSRKGYKIPVTVDDALSFVNHDSSIIVPMSSRLRAFRDGVRLATHGELDILARPEYSLLRCMLESADAGDAQSTDGERFPPGASPPDRSALP